MKVIFVSGLGSVWGAYNPRVLDEPGHGTVAGGEGALLETAFGLAAFGHEVDVFYPGARDRYKGVSFFPLVEASKALATGEYDVLASWSDAEAIVAAPARTRRVFVQQLNDMPEAKSDFWREVDVIVPASATHGRFLATFAPPGLDVAWIPLYAGVRAWRYEKAPAFGARAPIVLYASSPDRGLHHVLAAWPKVRKEIPDAEFRIAYHLERFVEGAQGSYRHQEVCWRARVLDRFTRDREVMRGVRVLGAIPRERLAEHQCEAKVYAFPLDPVTFTEGLSQNVGEAIAAGEYVITRPIDALPEVYSGLVEFMPGGALVDTDDLARRIVAALRLKAHPFERETRDFAKRTTWEWCSRNLERALKVPAVRLVA